MNTKINIQTILIVLMLCVTVIVSTNTYAKAQGGGISSSTEFAPESEIMLDPVPGGPGYIMVSVFDFIPYETAFPHAYIGTGLYNPSIATASYSVAGLTLPHGATITKLTLYYYDNANINMNLYLYNAVAESYSNFLASVSSEGALGIYRSVSQTNIVDPIVDNQNFSYWLYLIIPPNGDTDLLLTNVRIDYEYTSNLPAVMKN